MKEKWALDRKGIALIELLVVLVTCALMMHAIYRLFITQTRAYAVQDQVMQVQQSVRSTMEVLLKDLRMAGCDENVNNDPYSGYQTPVTPIVTPVASNSITVNYRYYDNATGALTGATVTYSLVGTDLQRTLTLNGVVNPTEVILSNVNSLTFTYGIDATGNGTVTTGTYVAAASVPNPLGTNKIISVRVQLTAKPTPDNPDNLDNPDVKREVSPRTLSSIVTLRNLL